MQDIPGGRNEERKAREDQNDPKMSASERSLATRSSEQGRKGEPVDKACGKLTQRKTYEI